MCTLNQLSFIILLYGLTGVPVSYTHLDVYKRQDLDSEIAANKDEIAKLEAAAADAARKQQEKRCV